MNEVCELCQIKPYVLRFWDSEFDQIKSVANSSGKKLYQRRDVIVISCLKDLLFDRKLTIEKARLELESVNIEQLLENQSSLVSQSPLDLESNIVENYDKSSHEARSHQKESLAWDERTQEAKQMLRNVLTKIENLKTIYNWT